MNNPKETKDHQPHKIVDFFAFCLQELILFNRRKKKKMKKKKKKERKKMNKVV